MSDYLFGMEGSGNLQALRGRLATMDKDELKRALGEAAANPGVTDKTIVREMQREWRSRASVTRIGGELECRA